MGRFGQSFTSAVSLLLAGISVGCGGGSASNIQSPPPPPPSADFSVGINSSSISIIQGAVSAPVVFSVIAHNGFSAAVQVTLTDLPAGVSSNPASPFTTTPGVDTAVIFGAAANAVTGDFTISAQGVSGSLSHGAKLTLAIQSSIIPNLPRTTFVRTDSTPAADNPPLEARHRHLVYDPGHKNVFVANRAMNRLEVFSAVDQSSVAQIAIPGVTSADLSADGTTVWAGTALNGIVAVDTESLQVKRRYMQNGVSPAPSTIFDRPVEVLSLANGECFLRLRQSNSPETLPALWDPVSGSLTNLTPAAALLFQNGLGPIARSGDQSKILVAANDSSGELAVFAPNGAVTTGPRSIGSGLITWVAANSDGSGFAAAFTSNGTTHLVLLDAALNQLASHASSIIHGMTFSRDGNFLYLGESLPEAPVVTVLHRQDLHVLGQLPSAAIQGVTSQIEDVDETQLLFGVSNRGVNFIDASTSVALSSSPPTFAAVPASAPSEGPGQGGTALILSGQNFLPDTLIKIGTQLATNVSVFGPTSIQVTSPASFSNGAVNVIAYASNNWLAIAPDGFSYGPKILRVLPNAGVNTGGDTVQVFGYGFGSDPSGITVKIGGSNAIVQSVDNISAIAPALGVDITYPFPLERITLQPPPGVSGTADVAVTAPSGFSSATKAFQYLVTAQSYSKPGFYRFLVYDQKRQRVYLSNIDHVDVFDLKIGAFVSPIQPLGGPPPNAGLRGLAMSPDGSQLIVADFGAQSVYLFDPDTGFGTSTLAGGVSGFASSGPSRIAATSTQTVFVGLSGEGSSGGGCASCLAQMNLSVSPPTIQPAPQPEVSSFTGAPLLQGNTAGDHVLIAFGNPAGSQLAVWNANTPDQFTLSSANVSVKDISIAADGSNFALQTDSTTEVRDSRMFTTAVPVSGELTQIPGRNAVPGLAMHATGALIYQPFLTGPAGTAGVKGGVDILDTRSGALRLRIFLPQQFMTDVDALHGSFLTIDENGQRLFALTSLDGSPQNASLTVVQLATVPLAIATVSPADVPATGGASLTVRGSGFQPGIKVTIGGKSAAAALVDMNTLTVVLPALVAGPQQLTLTNNSGETVSLDAAIIIN